ncbi:BTB/POZ domain-containing protein 6-A-like [Periplaneta americana]|uniref:BTB/POZ domain-containing protein 6-A-like n=1 Tax=Periplaneta americana TaxID=6978 RepID=UPI0037E7EA3B
MDNCQRSKYRLVERGLEALEKGLAADCKFLVGEEKEEIAACKALLAIASPVFEKQFYGSIAEKDPVELLDIEPDAFKKLLQYIYTHRVDIISSEEALELIKVAHKYWLSDLIEICVVYYLDNLKEDDIKGLCDILNISVLYDLDFKDMVVRRAQQNTDLLLKSKEFVDLSVDGVICIVQRGQLNVSNEMELIDAAVLWATARSEEKDTSLSGKSVKSVLVETGVFKHLRFLTLTNDQLKLVNILSDEEMKATKYSIYSGSDLPPPVSICSISKPRNFKSFLKNIQSEEVRCKRSILEVSQPGIIGERFEVCGKTGPYNLIDVKICSQMTNTTPENYAAYEEELEVEIIRLKEQITGFRCNYVNDHIIATGYFKGRVKYNDIITVPLDLKLGVSGFHRVTEGDKFKIQVTFHKVGKYPAYQANTSPKIFNVSKSKGIVVEINYTS